LLHYVGVPDSVAWLGADAGPSVFASPSVSSRRARRGDRDATCVADLGPGHLPPEYRQLMAQRDDLEVLGAPERNRRATRSRTRRAGMYKSEATTPSEPPQ
jgi:hypothetical protein